MSTAEWDAIFQRQQWGRWPDTRFVEWCMRTFGNAPPPVRERIRVLELGCGAGAQLRFLQGEGFQAFGVDGSKAAIQQAKANLALSDGFGPRPRLAVEDLLTFNIPLHWGEPEFIAPGTAAVTEPMVERLDMGGFDCIVDVCTLQHPAVTTSAQIVQRAHRWLKPGGWIFSKWRAHLRGGPTPPPPPRNMPVPYQLERDQIDHIFPGFERHVTLERVTHESGEETAHWIITGRKV